MLADLRTYILADSNISGFLSNRLHSDRIPKNSTYPVANYAVKSEEVTNTHGSDLKELNRDVVQIDVYAKSGAEARDLKNALKLRLNSKNLTQGNTRFGYIEWDGSFSSYETETELFRQVTTIKVTWSPV